MNTELKSWAEETVNYLHAVATDKDNPEMDLSFYAFRTEPKINPNVVFLGINPGEHDYSYADLYKNPIWGLEKEGRMTPERFIKADPSIEDLDKWKIWIELQKSFGNIDFFKDYIFMNLIYFNTKKVEDLFSRKNGLEVYRKNIEFTTKLLVDIIKPKYIVCLGTKDCFDRLVIEEEVLLKTTKRLVVTGFLGDIKVFGIPHPSGSYTSNEHKKEIGKVILRNMKC